MGLILTANQVSSPSRKEFLLVKKLCDSYFSSYFGLAKSFSTTMILKTTTQSCA